MEEIILPIAGMMFVLTLIFGWPVIRMLKNRQQLGRSEEIEDCLAHLDELEERMRVVEAVITEENYRFKHQLNDLERLPPK